MAAVTDECRETFEEDIALRGRGRANSQWLRVFLKGAADPATFVNWPSCKEYDLVDAWEEEDQPLLGQAQYRMLPWPEVARFVAVPPPDDLYVSGARELPGTAPAVAMPGEAGGAAARHLTGRVPARIPLPKIKLTSIHVYDGA